MKALCSTGLQSIGVEAREKSGDRSQQTDWEPGSQRQKKQSIVLNGSPKCRSRTVVRLVMLAAWVKPCGGQNVQVHRVYKVQIMKTHYAALVYRMSKIRKLSPECGLYQSCRIFRIIRRATVFLSESATSQMSPLAEIMVTAL